MFLAWKELLYSKLKFSLIIGVLVLIGYLLFLISGLSNGLMNMNREAIDTWGGDAIIMTEESNQNLAQSVIDKDAVEGDFKDISPIRNTAVITSTDDRKQNALLFGIDKGTFIEPEVIEGKMFKEDFEVVADDTFKEKGFKIGDDLDLAGTDESLTITGFTAGAKYNAAPILYANNDTADVLTNGRLKDKVNAFVVKDPDFKNIKVNNDLQVVDTESFIKKLPGYTEQKLTLDFMSYFLFAISAFIIGIFLYVITIQKAPIYGLLKAQGISNSFLGKSVIYQTLMLSVLAVIIALALTFLTAYFLPPVVPIIFKWQMIAIYAATLIITALLGGLFSIRSVQKVDPLKTIG
ncbi:ABC transporter permease [Macrococcus carouselicus]|uniref:Putative hemin transport system permease protein HrtB n=1 Tax=Macrococcus carouselicus TaxID=69969 RepID=A0A9Q8CH00_9STAP|nr:FtsX-like permease family protein [Macrococcus carouselicus]TDM02136.1 FtsX-like permease family protein [Macrococcus carouselicus]